MPHIHLSSIKLVDGFKIRNTLDPDFGIFHTHSCRAGRYAPKFYIPQGEWWLDVIAEKERDFLIRVESIETGNLAGHHLRSYLKKQIILSGPIPKFLVRREPRRNLRLMFVDGAVIRKYMDPEFILGGHDLIYPSYIPKGEIWLEAGINKKEAPFVFEHEFLERTLMSKGKSYDIAHEYGTSIEREMRRRAGVGCYPGDVNYKWRHLTNEEIVEKYYLPWSENAPESMPFFDWKSLFTSNVSLPRVHDHGFWDRN
jgi:hypothetical protein